MYKKVSVLLLLVFLALPIALGTVDVTKTSPSYVQSDELLQASININTDEWLNSIDIYEFTPKGWIITGWEIEGYDKVNVIYETHEEEYREKDRTSSHWRFNKRFFGTITINYELEPLESGTIETLTVWTYEGGFGDLSNFVNIIPGTATPPTVPETEPVVEIEKITGVTMDLTLLAIIVIITGFILAAVLLVIFGKKKILDAKTKLEQAKAARGKTSIAVDDLRAFIKLGLKRGYTLREMVNALRAGNIDTFEFNKIAKEEMIKKMDMQARKRETNISSAYERKLMKIIKNLKNSKR